MANQPDKPGRKIPVENPNKRDPRRDTPEIDPNPSKVPEIDPQPGVPEKKLPPDPMM
ncbi:hypothetical protein [Bdellovibrio sp. HCB274]|uniref:hypothetical protein n=1 Tax=Bdellovibrio sp. HCB274 TaxID=3394361 RepID=UPI0039B4234F